MLCFIFGDTAFLLDIAELHDFDTKMFPADLFVFKLDLGIQNGSK